MTDEKIGVRKNWTFLCVGGAQKVIRPLTFDLQGEIKGSHSDSVDLRTFPSASVHFCVRFLVTLSSPSVSASCVVLLCLDTCVDNSTWLFPPAGIKQKKCLSHLSSPLMPSTVLSRTAKVSSSTRIIAALSIRFVLFCTVFLVEPVRSPDCKMLTWKRIH